jgi:hypothetical protein
MKPVPWSHVPHALAALAAAAAAVVTAAVPVVAARVAVVVTVVVAAAQVAVVVTAVAVATATKPTSTNKGPSGPFLLPYSSVSARFFLGRPATARSNTALGKARNKRATHAICHGITR